MSIVNTEGKSIISDQLKEDMIKGSIASVKSMKGQIDYITMKIRRDFLYIPYIHEIHDKLKSSSLFLEQCIRTVERKPFFADIIDDKVDIDPEIEYMDDPEYKDLGAIAKQKLLRKKIIEAMMMMQSSVPANQMIAAYGARAINEAEEAVMWIVESLRAQAKDK